MEKIVYLDIDGTILNNEGKISNFTKNILLDVQKRGIGVVLATGRNFQEIQDIAQDLDLDHYLNYAICENGAYITRTNNLNPEFLKTIDETEAKKLCQFLNEQGICVSISTYDLKNNSLSMTSHQMDCPKANKFLMTKKTPTLDDNINWSSICMMTFDAKKNQSDDLEAYFAKNFPNIEVLVSKSKYRKKPFFMISQKDVSKANAIKNLNNYFQINDDQTYFFGDGINDLLVIKNFKNSYVPKTAPDYVLSEAASKNIIGAADKDGVAKKLQELFLI